MTNKPKQIDLLSVWFKVLDLFGPKNLILHTPSLKLSEGEAALFWGKASGAFFDAVGVRGKPALIISPDEMPAGMRLAQWVKGEHPLPGEGSFEAGAILLDFFDSLRKRDIRQLRVYLSGGASSTAWIKPAGMRHEELLRILRELYARPLSIAELNRRRARLCHLKAGGSALWLRELSPRTRVKVEVISDVLPFGPEVVGSGPFWKAGISHRVVADNADLVRALGRELSALGCDTESVRSGQVQAWQSWVQSITASVNEACAANLERCYLVGGEPQVSLRARSVGRGGRMSHLAAALILRNAAQFRTGRLELLCGASDGVDGRSGSGGVHFGLKEAARIENWTRFCRDLSLALETHETGRLFERIGALVPSHPSGTNLQDVVMVRTLKARR